MANLVIDGRDKTAIGRSAPEILDGLARITSDNYPPKQGDFYTFKFVSMEAALKAVSMPGDWAQFGVYKGVLARMMLNKLPKDSQLHLFDSFEGLPEDWISTWQAGTFKLAEDEIPTFSDPRVHIHKGWFNDTVPKYMNRDFGTLAFVHVDCDLYSSTVDSLHSINDRIKPDTIILFDEYMIAREGETDDGEHRALMEWLEKYDRKIEYLWRTNWVQVAVRVLR